MAATKIDCSTWLNRIAWDGLLVLTMLLVPIAVDLIAPGNWRPIEDVAIIGLPILALLIRMKVGAQQIASNNSGIAIKFIQTGIFAVGILVLVFFDSFLLALQFCQAVMPPAPRADWLILAAAIAIYAMLMAIATFPGRGRVDVHANTWQGESNGAS